MAESDKRNEIHWTRKVQKATSAEDIAIAIKSDKDSIDDLIKKARELINIDEK